MARTYREFDWVGVPTLAPVGSSAKHYHGYIRIRDDFPVVGWTELHVNCALDSLRRICWFEGSVSVALDEWTRMLVKWDQNMALSITPKPTSPRQMNPAPFEDHYCGAPDSFIRAHGTPEGFISRVDVLFQDAKNLNKPSLDMADLNSIGSKRNMTPKQLTAALNYCLGDGRLLGPVGGPFTVGSP